MAIETGGARARTNVRMTGPTSAAPIPGDRAAAFGKLYDDLLPDVYAFVSIRVPDRTAAEDVTKRVFERAVAVAGELERGGSVAGFLHRVASSAVFDHARRTRDRLPGDVRASDYAVPGDRAAIAQIVNAHAARAFAAAIDRIALRRAAARVQDENLHVLLLHYLDGFGPGELAAALGCPEAEAALQLHQAMDALERQLELEWRDGHDGLVPVGGPIEDAADPGAQGLARLDAQLRAAGAHARRALHGTTQPTRWFAQHLRIQLLDAISNGATGGQRSRD